jgi:hypothetical protein
MGAAMHSFSLSRAAPAALSAPPGRLQFLAQTTPSPTGEAFSSRLEQTPTVQHQSTTDREIPRVAASDFGTIPLFPPDRITRPHAKSRLSRSPLPGFAQRKLFIGEANDPLEQAADRIAYQVMRMPETRASSTSAPPQLNRKCTACEEEDKQKRLTKPAATPRAADHGAPSIVHEVLRSPGQLLDAATLAFFEPRFGYDLSQVRVHSDERAAVSARSVGALAYTVGPHIALAANMFVSSSDAGRHIVAHELAHVLQQSQRASVTLQRWTYEDSCGSLLDVLSNADDMAQDMVQKAIAALSNSQPDPWVDKSLFNWFGISASNPNKADFVAAILGVYGQISSHFNAGDYDYECNCHDCPDPSVDLGCTSIGQGPITVCMANQHGGTPGTAATIVHEMSHRFPGLDDYSYCEPTCVNLAPDKAIGNAASYKEFASEAWLHGAYPPTPAPTPPPAP